MSECNHEKFEDFKTAIFDNEHCESAVVKYCGVCFLTRGEIKTRAEVEQLKRELAEEKARNILWSWVPPDNAWVPTVELIVEMQRLKARVVELYSCLDCWERLGLEISNGMTGNSDIPARQTHDKLRILLSAADKPLDK